MGQSPVALEISVIVISDPCSLWASPALVSVAAWLAGTQLRARKQVPARSAQFQIERLQRRS